MPYAVGGHPAFIWDKEGTLSFSHDQAQLYPVLSSGIAYGKQVGLEETLVDTEMFENDALIYSGLTSVKFSNGDRSVEMDLSDFSYLGIWSQVGAPFICLEPWSTLPDQINHDKNILSKKDIIVLEPSTSRILSYTLKLS